MLRRAAHRRHGVAGARPDPPRGVLPDHVRLQPRRTSPTRSGCCESGSIAFHGDVVHAGLEAGQVWYERLIAGHAVGKVVLEPDSAATGVGTVTAGIRVDAAPGASIECREVGVGDQLVRHCRWSLGGPGTGDGVHLDPWCDSDLWLHQQLGTGVRTARAAGRPTRRSGRSAQRPVGKRRNAVAAAGHRGRGGDDHHPLERQLALRGAPPSPSARRGRIGGVGRRADRCRSTSGRPTDQPGRRRTADRLPAVSIATGGTAWAEAARALVRLVAGQLAAVGRRACSTEWNHWWPYEDAEIDRTDVFLAEAEVGGRGGSGGGGARRRLVRPRRRGQRLGRRARRLAPGQHRAIPARAGLARRPDARRRGIDFGIWIEAGGGRSGRDRERAASRAAGAILGGRARWAMSASDRRPAVRMSVRQVESLDHHDGRPLGEVGLQSRSRHRLRPR